MKRNEKSTSRCVQEIGQGDFVKVKGFWKEVVSNTAYGEKTTPRNWTIETKDGSVYDMWGIERYAKKEDMEK